jgi:hypothetical protein
MSFIITGPEEILVSDSESSGSEEENMILTMKINSTQRYYHVDHVFVFCSISFISFLVYVLQDKIYLLQIYCYKYFKSCISGQ